MCSQTLFSIMCITLLYCWVVLTSHIVICLLLWSLWRFYIHFSACHADGHYYSFQYHVSFSVWNWMAYFIHVYSFSVNWETYFHFSFLLPAVSPSYSYPYISVLHHLILFSHFILTNTVNWIISFYGTPFPSVHRLSKHSFTLACFII